MDSLFITLSIVFVIIISIFMFLKKIITNLKKELLEHIDSKFSDQTIIKSSLGANFFGQKSKGVGQIRGNGAIVLTEKLLYFRMMYPKRSLTIPIEDIKGVGTIKSFLGKSVFLPLLSVKFVTEYGEDEAAWAIKNPEIWIEKIDEIRDKK